MTDRAAVMRLDTQYRSESTDCTHVHRSESTDWIRSTGQRVQTVHLHRSESTDCAHVQVTEYRLFTYTGQRVKPVHTCTQVREYRLDTQYRSESTDWTHSTGPRVQTVHLYMSESTDCTLAQVRECRLCTCTGHRVQTVHMHRSESKACTHVQRSCILVSKNCAGQTVQTTQIYWLESTGVYFDFLQLAMRLSLANYKYIKILLSVFFASGVEFGMVSGAKQT